ncbi:(2Fe-2S) ferredoxin domain-containing protein [Solidesulfovibrio sp.]|uniref:(2Fe-2S) ferredoxin domain-containing protein n=1 Tax=Solidesulfovibrio sp. TaxID=2910990 RepID=UPI002B21D2BC|nr:(2Fe-2S) ferredoxin domain-containing protein [Solidesulfovibrio sp.]MEA4858147.1 (2Fe-2S) ferredoxin domain-containing protein [Solidesulfovibrio sp.]
MAIEKPKYLINVCASFRVKGEAKGICHKKGSHNLLGYFEEGVLDRDIDARIVSTGCMKQCEEGPIVVVMPENWGSRAVDSEDKVDQILDALESGEPCEDLLLP